MNDIINTERLVIHMASKAEMEAIIKAQTDTIMKQAYTEMLDGCLKNPDMWEWYAIWIISTKDGRNIGDYCFKGLENGVTEIGYGLYEGFCGHGYATEAVKAAIKWAFTQPDVKKIEAEAEENNYASLNVIRKCGFLPTGKNGEEGPRFYIDRPTYIQTVN